MYKKSTEQLGIRICYAHKLLLMMKLIFVLSVLTMLHAAADDSYAQNINIRQQNVPLEKIFRQIRKQTGYDFFFNQQLLKDAKPATLNISNGTVEEALRQCLAGQQLDFSIENKIIIIKRKVAEKPSATILPATEKPLRLLTGRVTDEKGEALPGVSILIKGTQQGTTTGAAGTFELNVPDQDAILIFSFVGFVKKEIAVGNQSNLSISLSPEEKAFEEVVVVGYGVEKKENLTGAVSTISSKVIENRPVTNAVAALQGAAPGLVVTRSSGQPGNEGYNLNIRGFSSLNGTNSPLVIVDGVEGDMSILNPNDIENISVLKDASAAAIYGAKAASGVIIVTTKKGLAGRPKLEYSMLYTVNKPYRMPELLNSWEQAEMERTANLNAGLAPGFSDQQIEWMRTGKDTVRRPDGNLDYYFNTDILGIVMRKTTSSQNHNLALSGGNDKTQYLIGLGYFSQNGIFQFGPDNFKRYNIRFNLNQKLSSIFTIDSRISYGYTDANYPNGNKISGQYGYMYNFYTQRRRFPVYLPGSNDTKFAQGSGYEYFLRLKEGGYDQLANHNLNGVFTFSANIAKGLVLKAVYGPGLVFNNGESFNRPVARWNYNNPVSPSSYTFPAASLSKTRFTQVQHNVQALADYTWKLGESHNFHALGGYEYKSYNFDQIGVSVTGLISNDIPSLNAYAPTSSFVPSDNIQTNVWLSYFGRLNYNYKDKYLFEANLRNDASSRLAPGYRSQTFPAFSLGWAIDKETFFEPASRIFSMLKLRASWGKLGNAQLGALNARNYDYIAQLNTGPTYPFNNLINKSYYQADLPSSGLGWETVQTVNAGLDFALFKNKLTGSFEYFVRDNNDMLITINYPSTLGVNPRTTNGASMRTKGWELTLGWRDKIATANYFVNFNLGDNTNKITAYKGQTTYAEGVNRAIEGYPINSIFGFRSEGYFTDEADVQGHAFQHAKNAAGDIKYQDVNGDGRIDIGSGTEQNHGDLIYLGNTSPRFSFGLNLGADWKGFDLGMMWQGVGKINQFLAPNLVVPKAAAWIQPFRAQTDTWTPTNTDARYPRLFNFNTDNVYGNPDFFNGRISSHWVQEAAYIRLKNLQLGYTLPVKVTSRIKVQRLRVYFTGQDLWEATKMWFPYVDPETPSDPTRAAWAYPLFRSYAFGLNITL